MKFRKALMMFAMLALTFAGAAMAEETGAVAAAGGVDTFASLAAGLTIAIAVFGGATAQGRAASSAIEGIARNPNAQNKLFIPMIIALALIESLVLLAFIIAFVKIGA